ncbi:hypothetical protein [Brachybacterium paraconglomeratum]|uniref:hypothetical protein n=1 Tax=Brachybacterium paraconglomeratum TaxID=173362 RepID=UPI0022AF1506|nr:hypothetical protein [Brachybacterium paraconglomeratum]MCZ4326738.1 hypothetical protein [Brachybacterium paraconglomeratum]
MSETTALLGLNDLAHLLRGEGIDVLSEDTVVATAKAARAAVSASPPQLEAAIVLDSGEPFLDTWVRAAAPHLEGVVVLHGEHRTVGGQHAHHVDLPVDVETVLTAAGVDAPPAAAGWTINTDGSVTAEDSEVDEPSAQPADADDDWGIPPDPQPGPEEPGHDPTPPPPLDADATGWTQEGESAAEDDAPEADSTPSGGTTSSPIATRRRQRLAAQPTPPAPRQTAGTHAEDIFSSTIAPGGVLRAGPDGCPVLLSLSLKGGVGKTSNSIGTAERAASRGLKVTLIDMNRGQADLMTILKLTHQGQPVVPTIFDAVTGKPSAAIVEPAVLNAARDRKYPALDYRVVLGPPRQLADPAVVTDGLYRSVIEEARKDSDLVIVDTQMMEATDNSRLIDRVVIPYLSTGHWAILVSEMSSSATSNTKLGALQIIESGVPSDHLLSYVNRVPGTLVDSAEMRKIPAFFGQFSSYLGHVASDDSVTANMNAGLTNQLPAEMNAIFDEVLFRATGLEKPPPPAPSAPERTGLLSRLLGGRR